MCPTVRLVGSLRSRWDTAYACQHAEVGQGEVEESEEVALRAGTEKDEYKNE